MQVKTLESESDSHRNTKASQQNVLHVVSKVKVVIKGKRVALVSLGY